MDKDYYNDPKQMWVLFCGGDLVPIDFFWHAVKKNYTAVNDEFKSKFGFNLPLMLKPETPVEKAHRIIFWNWVRKKYSTVDKLRADIFRKEVVGKGILASNVHFDTQVDYPLYGAAFDEPGFAIRPQMTNNKLDWEYLIGYGTRLAADLTGKLPVISVRTNLGDSGSWIVPTAKTIKYWYSQAIQNGCVGFYMWEYDFPADTNGYVGNSVGNPDSSALGKERWNTALEMSRELGTTKIFDPPKSQTAILVSLDANALGNYGWKKTFSAYVDLCKARVFANFISDQAIKDNLDSLSEYKVVYIPFMNFEKREVAQKIIHYVRNGGIIISGDPTIFSYDLKGRSMTELRKELFGVEKISKRSKASSAKLDGSYDNLDIRPYSNEAYDLTADNSARVIGRYEDGKAAITEKDFGKGKAIYFGIPILDIYLYSKKAGFRENIDMYKFLDKIAGIAKTKNLSWIWDITVNNIKEVTGTIPVPVPKPVKAIKFRGYLNSSF